MASPKEDALETLTGLKADFAEAVKEAQEDGSRWKWLRHFNDPKGRENEFLGYTQQASAAAELIGKDDKGGATAGLSAMKASFAAVAADCRAQPMDLLESFFGIEAKEAQKFEGYAAAVDKVMKLI